MSTNRYQPHVLVIPEDDANRQLANGFVLALEGRDRSIQVLQVAGGWRQVLRRFQSEQTGQMEKLSKRLVVLLIDFDGDDNRLNEAKMEIPEHLKARVFILGAWTEPEELRKSGLGSYETIGEKMAADCRDNTSHIWGHQLLCHNAGELDRLREHVRPILF